MSLVLPSWESLQRVKRTAHFDAHLRVSSTPRFGSATASGTGAYSNFHDAERVGSVRIPGALRVQGAQMRPPSTPRGAVETLRAIERTVSHRMAWRKLQELLACREFDTQERCGIAHNTWGGWLICI